VESILHRESLVDGIETAAVNSLHGGEAGWLFQERFEDIAVFANMDLEFVASILGAITEGAAQIPAHMPATKLIGRAVFFFATEFFFPARYQVFLLCLLMNEQKIEFFFGMFGNISPALFVAMNGP
jgi:hypothetical protein